jgi:pSer/pThr/pTyr-binding forkhead associated (FHA) protein
MLPESEPIENGLSDESLNAPNTEHSVFPRTVRITLHILPNATRTLKFPHNARILVGRADDEETANDLMLELSHYGGESNGVSRIHAAIHDQDGMVYITDLNSTNGTRINGYKLDAGRAYRLRNGDELELGRLRLVVMVVRPPS